MNIKKISAAALAAAILATAAPVTGVLPDVMSVAANAYEYDENGLCIEDGVLTKVSENVISVVIPDGVTEIDNHTFKDCTSLTSVTIPNSVTEIGWLAFINCTSLTAINVANDNPNYCSVDGVLYNKDKTTIVRCPGAKPGIFTIPDSVTRIDLRAFAECTSLTGVYLHSKVAEIGSSAFKGCTSLISVEIPISVTELLSNTFEGCTSLATVSIPNSVTEIGYDVFNGCTSLSNVTIAPGGLTLIDTGAFYNCTSLKKFTIPNGVTKIGNRTFAGCTKLSDITIPNSVTDIGNDPFEDCTSLTSITIPKNVTYIYNDGATTFDGCTSLTDIYVDEDNPKYCSISGMLCKKEDGEITIMCCPEGKSGDFIIPHGVTNVYGFDNCKKLTSVTIPDSVTLIYGFSFVNCTNLTSVTIPDSVTGIGEGAFLNCTSLTSITIPKGVTYIGILDYMLEYGHPTFGGCTSLTNVTIPDGMVRIGAGAFSGCTSLTSVTIPGSVTEFSKYAFNGCTSLTNYNVDNNNPNYCSVDGVLYNKAKTTIMRYPAAKSGSFAIPNTVTKIEDYAFEYCASLTSITIPGSVTEISSYAFYNSGLTTIYGVKGTYAETYANENGYQFIEVTAPTHTHTYSSDWSSDDTNHWHAAACEHTGEVSSKAAHTFDNGTVTTPTTTTSAGVKTYTCTVCGKTKTESIPKLSGGSTTGGSSSGGSSSGGWSSGGSSVSTPAYFSVTDKTISGDKNAITATARVDAKPGETSADNSGAAVKVAKSDSAVSYVKIDAPTNTTNAANWAEPIVKKADSSKLADVKKAAEEALKAVADDKGFALNVDILNADRKTVEPGNNVEVTVPVPAAYKGKSLYAYRVTERGVVPILATTANDKITFNAGGAGEYIFTTEKLTNSLTYVKGNVDLEGKTSAKDATEVLKHIVDLKTLKDEQLFIADANGDGIVNAKDATEILKMIVGIA